MTIFSSVYVLRSENAADASPKTTKQTSSMRLATLCVWKWCADDPSSASDIWEVIFRHMRPWPRTYGSVTPDPWKYHCCFLSWRTTEWSFENVSQTERRTHCVKFLKRIWTCLDTWLLDVWRVLDLRCLEILGNDCILADSYAAWPLARVNGQAVSTRYDMFCGDVITLRIRAEGHQNK